MRNEVSFWCPTSIVDTHLHPLISCEVSIMGKVTNQCEPVLPVTVSRRCGKAEHVFHRFPQAFSMAFLPCFSWSPAQLEKSQLTKDVDFTASRPSGRLRMTSPWMVAMLTLEVPQLVAFFENTMVDWVKNLIILFWSGWWESIVNLFTNKFFMRWDRGLFNATNSRCIHYPPVN